MEAIADRVEQDLGPKQVSAIIKALHTTKASLLHHALKSNAITDEQYLKHTFSIMFQATDAENNVLHQKMRPVVMCISESIDTLSYDLPRIFSLNSPVKHIKAKFTKDDDYWLFPTTLDSLKGDIEPLLRLLKSRGGVDKLKVTFEHWPESLKK